MQSTKQNTVAVSLAKCRNNPHRFHEVFHSKKYPNQKRMRPSYWQRQIEMGQSVVDYRVTCVYSGNSIGKDYWIAGIILWWLYTRPNSLVIVTGPTQTVIGTVTWKEVRRALEASILPRPKISAGITTSPALVEVKPGWHALGYSTTSVERASGQHAKHLLVIVEEASGVEDEIWDALESLKYSKLVAIGNPIRAEGRFVDLIRQAVSDREASVSKHHAVNAIQIPSTDSPDAGKEHSEYGLADKTWIEACYRRYGGKDAFWCRSHIHAIIPDVSSDLLIPPQWLDYATSVIRPNHPPNHPVHRSRRIAVDLGEGVGRDETAILIRDDHGILDLIAGNAFSLADAAEETARLSRFWNVPAERISYDKLGIGRDFHNHLVRRGLGDAIGYAGSGRAKNPKASTNLRTEAAWNLRQRLDPERHTDDRYPITSKQPPFHIPARAWWALLREDLEALSYDLVGNHTRLIAKDDLMIRLGRSPDRGDALIQSFAL